MLYTRRTSRYQVLSGAPMFLALLVMVGAGFLLTLWAYRKERVRKPSAA